MKIVRNTIKLLFCIVFISYFLTGCKKDDIIVEEPLKYENYFYFEADTFTLPSGVQNIYPREEFELNHGIISVSYIESQQTYFFGILLLSSNAFAIDYENGTKLGNNGVWNGVYLNGLTLNTDTIPDGEYWFSINKYPVYNILTCGTATIRYDFNDSGGHDHPLRRGGVVSLKKNGNQYEIDFEILSSIRDVEFKCHYKGELKMRNTKTAMLNFFHEGDFINHFIYRDKCYELSDCVLMNIERPTNLVGPGDLHPIYLYSKEFSIEDEYLSDNPSKYTGFNLLDIRDWGLTDTPLSTRTYVISPWTEYDRCLLRFNYNYNNKGNFEKEVSSENGVFSVELEDSFFKLDLSCKTDPEKDDDIFAHYEGKYRMIEK